MRACDQHSLFVPFFFAQRFFDNPAEQSFGRCVLNQFIDLAFSALYYAADCALGLLFSAPILFGFGPFFRLKETS